jgi:type IV pilus assembly protein PilY1
LLTDGEANHNDSAAFIRSYLNISSCAGSDADEECALELATELASKDQNSAVPGDQNVILHTIGFNTQDLVGATAFLKGLAAVHPDGTFNEATNAAQLAAVIKATVAQALSRTTSFASPSLSVNAFNKLFHRSDVYFSLFKPRNPIRWNGNVKKYQLCSSTTEDSDNDGNPDCTVLGEVLDADGVSAIDAAQLISTTARSFWSVGADGNVIDAGGAGNKIPVPSSRRVLTYTGTSAPSNENLGSAVNVVDDSNDDGILDGIAAQATPLARTQVLLGLPATANAGQSADLIDWLQGMDVDDEDDDGNRTESRYAFNDPLHSSPVAITFGGDAANPIDKLIVGTNDGGVRLINSVNGIEEWVFYPQETLVKQAMLRQNATGDHEYGMDATPVPWIYDDDADGVIEPADGDFVRVFIGQRRGGDNVYALDLTPTSTLTDPNATNGITPKLMWKVSGPATDAASDFARLGQTWSAPRIAKIPWGTSLAGQAVTKDVVIMAAGYDASRDTLFGPGGAGNAIYIIDASTGARMFTISADDPGTGSRVIVPDMVFPIPSDIAIFDALGERNINRMYVGDTGGQMWRVDIRPNLTATAGINVVVGKLATVSFGASDDVTTVIPAAEDGRKFFYPPDVVQVRDDVFASSYRYDLVVAVTGRRPNPLETDVEDRVYAFRDYTTSTMQDSNGNGIADSGTYTLLQGKTASLTGDLYDVTAINIDPDDATQATELQDLQNGSGWFIDFPGNGEKGLAAPIIIAGKLFFTTYLPEGIINFTTCALAEGAGRLWGVDVLSGASIFNWDDADGTSNLTISDRTYTLGAGIPSSAVPIFQEEGITLLIGGGGGATTVDPDVDLPRARTYWYEQ